MFKVKHKSTGEIFTVYSVIRDGYLAYFLFYSAGWYWESSTDYEPYHEENDISKFKPNYISRKVYHEKR